MSKISANWKEESIKTRIETVNKCRTYISSITIEKKNPLKQGLKLLYTYRETQMSLIEKKNPLKQGLKHDGLAS